MDTKYDLESCNALLAGWIEEKKTNKHNMAHLADRAIKVLETEIKYIEDNA